MIKKQVHRCIEVIHRDLLTEIVSCPAIRKTNLMNRLGTSYDLICNYLQLFLDKGLVVYYLKGFKITPLGLDYLAAINKVLLLLGDADE